MPWQGVLSAYCFDGGGGMSEWISVNDRLPEENDINGQSREVLAYNGNYFPARVDYDRNMHWFETVEFETIFNVTHWQPLPEPPK